MNSKIIAFSLYGDSPRYWRGVDMNLEAGKAYYPDFRCRFYVAENVISEKLEELKANDCEVVVMPAPLPGNHSGRLWRFLPAWNPSIDVVLVRDVDSVIGDREAAAVTEWLKSDRDFHIMHDHPHHKSLIMAGAWGTRNNLMNRLMINPPSPPHPCPFNYDQTWLNTMVHPHVRNISLHHAGNGAQIIPNTRVFPTGEHSPAFVGKVVTI